MKAVVRCAGWVLAGTVAASFAAGCGADVATCSAPTSGTFKTSLKFAQTIPIDLYCDPGSIDASACAQRAHPFDGATWTLAVDGSSATVTAGGSSWKCAATAPRSSPTTGPDGGAIAGTSCYLRLDCGEQMVSDGGPATVSIQILPTASTDVLVLSHDLRSDCCTDEYTGAWH